MMENIKTPQVDPGATKEVAKVLSLFHSIGLVLVQDESGETYAFFKFSDHMETHRIRSQAFKNIVAGWFWDTTTNGITPNTWNMVISALEGKANSARKKAKISLRLAGGRETIFLDLANERWEAVRITAEGWEVVQPDRPIFWRVNALLRLPTPQRERADFEALWHLLNIHEDKARRLVEAWLVTCLIPGCSVPLLVLNGEQGSSKSTATKLLRNLIDPHEAELRTLLPQEKDLFVAAQNSRILAFDNVSSFKKDISDALCKLVTGATYSARALYTDKEEAIIKAHNPIIMNGIPDFLTRGDLINRSVVIGLSPIPPSARKSERAFAEGFRHHHPAILAGLLDKLVAVLQLLPAVEAENHHLPRMTEYGLVGIALERVNGWPTGAFMEAYRANLSETNKKSLEASLVTERLVRFMSTRKEWEGTATRLLEELSLMDGGTPTWRQGWPQTAHGFSHELKRARPALAEAGIQIDERRTSSQRSIFIYKSVMSVTSVI